MFLRLRILFTILSAICLAALFPVGTFFGWGWAGACGLVAFLFFGVMLLCKQSQQMQESSTTDGDDGADSNDEDAYNKAVEEENTEISDSDTDATTTDTTNA